MDEDKLKVAWQLFTREEDNTIASSQLGALLREIGEPSSSREVCAVQGYLCAHARLKELPERISYTMFRKYHIYNTTPGRHDKTNELLVRRQIGKSKKNTRNILPAKTKYGLTQPPDEEGAGAVVLNWVSGTRSKSKKAGVSLIKMNIAAAGEGKVTAKAVNRYLRDNLNNPKLQRPNVVGRKPRSSSNNQRDPSITYGLAKTGPKEDICTTIFPGKMNPNNREDVDYVDTKNMKKKGRLPKPQPTYSSERLAKYVRQRKSEDIETQNRALWKMKKYEQVSKRI